MLHETVPGMNDAVASAKPSHSVRIRSPRDAATTPPGRPDNPGAASREMSGKISENAGMATKFSNSPTTGTVPKEAATSG